MGPQGGKAGGLVGKAGGLVGGQGWWPGGRVAELLAATEKPELHEVPGHSCNSGAQKSPKTTPREPPGNSTPEAHEPAK